MKKCTAQIVRAALVGDSTVRWDQRDAALSVLTERGQGGLLPVLLTQAQSAKYLNVSRSTIFRMCQDGELQCVMVRGLRRYRREDLDRIARGVAV